MSSFVCEGSSDIHLGDDHLPEAEMRYVSCVQPTTDVREGYRCIADADLIPTKKGKKQTEGVERATVEQMSVCTKVDRVNDSSLQMTQHSTLEITVMAYIVCLLAKCSSEQRVARVIQGLQEGDAFGKSDFVLPIDIACQNRLTHIVFEYDGAYYHQDKQRDLRKTTRLLETYPNVLIVRIRESGLFVLPMQDERLLQIETPPNLSTLAIALETIKGLVKQHPFASSVFTQTQPLPNEDAIHELVQQVKCRCDEAYRKQKERIRSLLNNDTAATESILKVHGVQCRMHKVASFLNYLRDDWNFSKRDLCTFFCGGVASKIGTEAGERALKEFLNYLRDDWNFSKEDLCKFFCNGVAAKIGTEAGERALKEFLNYLRDDWNFSKEDLCKFFCNGVAAKIGTEAGERALKEFLNYLRDDWNFSKRDLCTFFCGGVATKIGTEAGERALKEFLNYLRDDWNFFKRDLCTFFCNGVAAKIGTEAGERALKEFLNYLRDDWNFSKEDLCKFFCGGVAAKIGTEAGERALKEFLNYLRDDWNFSKEDLCKFFCDGVASKIGTEAGERALKEFLNYLRDDWNFSKEDLCKFFCNGVAAKIGTEAGERALKEFLNYLRDDWNFSKRDLCTFFCGGVAAKIGTEAGERALKEFLNYLRDDWNFSKEDLCKFFCDGVASKIGTEAGERALKEFLNYLRDDWNFSKEDLCKFFCDGVAAKIGTEAGERALKEFLNYLRDDWNFFKEDLCKFFCNGVAAHMNTPTEPLLRRWVAMVVTLFGPDHVKDAIKIAGNGSLISRRKNRLNESLLHTVKTVYNHFHNFLSETDARKFTVKLFAGKKTGCATMNDISKILPYVTTQLCTLQATQQFFNLKQGVMRATLRGVPM